MGFLQFLAVENGLEISPPGFWAPDIPERGGKHVVGPVQFAFFIHQHRPGKIGFIDISAGKMTGLEGDDDDAHVPFFKGLFLFPQLREMRPAGQSPQVAMKDHEQPVAAKFLQSMHRTCCIGQGKIRSG